MITVFWWVLNQSSQLFLVDFRLICTKYVYCSYYLLSLGFCILYCLLRDFRCYTDSEKENLSVPLLVQRQQAPCFSGHCVL